MTTPWNRSNACKCTKSESTSLQRIASLALTAVYPTAFVVQMQFSSCACACVCMEKYYRKQQYKRQGASLHRLRTRPANEYWTSLITLHWQTKTKCTWKQWKAQFTGPSFLFLNTNKCSMSYMLLLLYPIINTNVHNNLSVFLCLSVTKAEHVLLLLQALATTPIKELSVMNSALWTGHTFLKLLKLHNQ